MPEACSETQASDRFGITLDFVIKLHNGSITDEEAKRFLRREDPFKPAPPQVIQRPAPLFSAVASTNLEAIRAKETAACFVGGIWHPNGRDGDLDRWLAKNQSASNACVITTLAPSREFAFVESAQFFLRTAETDTVKLGNALIAAGYTMTPQQAEEMAAKTERGEATEMKTDSYANFYFVETGDKKNPVSVGRVFRRERQWSSHVCRLERARRWFVGNRFLLRNFADTSKL